MGIFGHPLFIAPAPTGPRGFHWMIPGLMGGMPRPGGENLSQDLAGLTRLKTQLLVSLTAEWKPDADLFASHNIDSLHVPITDFMPPTMDQAVSICQQAAAYTSAGRAVVFHCQAGKGRTGTLLAAMLIWAGASAQEAILTTRSRNADWIETEGQLAFLATFADFASGAAPSP